MLLPLGGLGGTYAGNPLACAAAWRLIEGLRGEESVARRSHWGEMIIGAAARDIAVAGQAHLVMCAAWRDGGLRACLRRVSA